MKQYEKSCTFRQESLAMGRPRLTTALRPFRTPAHVAGTLLCDRMAAAFIAAPSFPDPSITLHAALWPEGDPGEEDLREACGRDLQLFCETFFPQYCSAPFNQMHLDMFGVHDARIAAGERGWRDVTAAPRDSGKTSIRKMRTVRDILYGYEKYIGLGSGNFAHARDKVKELRDIFTENAEILRVYGPQETGSPGAPGRWAEHDFITRTHVRIRAITPKMKVRGFLWNGRRLTLALLDDIEDPEMVLTPLRRERLLQWLNSDVAALGEPDMNFDVIGTILHEESMLSKTLVNPGFRARIYRAITCFAATDEAVALWGEWREIMLNLDDAARLIHAHQFYLAHEPAMLGASEVFWPARQPYEWLMIQRLIFGETSFWQERQNDPHKDARYIFDMDAAVWFATREDALVRSDGRLVHFLDMVSLAAYWDPTPDRQQTSGDYTCCAVGMKDKYGYTYVVDAYCEQEASTDVAMDNIVDLIWYWRIPQVGVEANGFASLLVGELRRKIAERAAQKREPWAVSFVAVKNMRNKILRIKSLDPLIANGWLAFAETLPGAFVQQFRDFIPVDGLNKFDDSPDCCEGLCRVLGGLFDRRAAF